MKNFFEFLKQRYCKLYCEGVHDKVCKISGCKIYDFFSKLKDENISRLVDEYNLIRKSLERPQREYRTLTKLAELNKIKKERWNML